MLAPDVPSRWRSCAEFRIPSFFGLGNLPWKQQCCVFRTRVKNTKTLERRIEKGLRHALGYEVADTELAQIVNCRQFRISEADGRDFNIIFLADPLSERLKCKVMALKTDTDEFSVHGREIYWLRRKKQSGVGFSSIRLEKTLTMPFTTRGGRTIEKMALKNCFNV